MTPNLYGKQPKKVEDRDVIDDIVMDAIRKKNYMINICGGPGTLKSTLCTYFFLNYLLEYPSRKKNSYYYIFDEHKDNFLEHLQVSEYLKDFVNFDALGNIFKTLKNEQNQKKLSIIRYNISLIEQGEQKAFTAKEFIKEVYEVYISLFNKVKKEIVIPLTRELRGQTIPDLLEKRVPEIEKKLEDKNIKFSNTPIVFPSNCPNYDWEIIDENKKERYLLRETNNELFVLENYQNHKTMRDLFSSIQMIISGDKGDGEKTILDTYIEEYIEDFFKRLKNIGKAIEEIDESISQKEKDQKIHETLKNFEENIKFIEKEILNLVGMEEMQRALIHLKNLKVHLDSLAKTKNTKIIKNNCQEIESSIKNIKDAWVNEKSPDFGISHTIRAIINFNKFKDKSELEAKEKKWEDSFISHFEDFRKMIAEELIDPSMFLNTLKEESKKPGITVLDSMDGLYNQCKKEIVSLGQLYRDIRRKDGTVLLVYELDEEDEYNIQDRCQFFADGEILLRIEKGEWRKGEKSTKAMEKTQWRSVELRKLKGFPYNLDIRFLTFTDWEFTEGALP